ncbi:hypothetical protein AJ79_04408 [Helicocarpus griseus UAMH5409]|uniref:beta-glucosidase n=1 Tax=Helicocarpus griseus UAMH5409 TaxID=1447875 RepID=A0A2B7XUF8_9EURO|nr:hypothetical protein AJ79_04408 [Helicocarpus griseus UAMH5409]
MAFLFSSWTFLLVILASCASSLSTDNRNAVYRDASQPVEARVSDLVSRMTIEDKMAQLMQGDLANWLNTTSGTFNYSGLVDNMKYKAGSFYVGHPISWDDLTENIKRGQDYLVENTTLGIPALVHSEGIHGFLIGNATIFNSPIGYGCSWNRKLVNKMAALIAQESLALGVNQLFAPVVDLAREMRYGRVEESISEDGYLTGELAYEFVKGLQGGNVSATVKHFVGVSSPEQGINTAPVHGGERELRTTWMPPFKRAIIDAGAWSIMSAYHSYDGVPAVSDPHTLTDILRGEWGYKNWVISDAGATDRLCDSFKLCRSEPIDSDSVTLQVLPAGGDVEMGGGSFNFKSIPHLVDDGKLNIEIVDTAVSRLLRAKFEMGLFEQPYPGAPKDQWNELIRSDEALELARELDKESIVLLENHDNTLPLKKSGSIAVLGPMAHGFMNYGDYVVYKSQYRGITPLDGIKAAVGDKMEVNYAQGCERWSNDKSGFPEAIKAAKKSDVAVVVVGTWSRDQQELWQGLNATTGEHVDVNSLNLVGAQRDLVREIADTGVPTVVVFSSGKPVSEPWIANSTAALVQQFYPSEQGGHALADVLFGDYNPSGKLSVSFPHDIGSSPTFYDYLNSARSVGDSGFIHENGSISFGHQYVIGTPHPWYEFGYGKSYSTFTYSDVTLDKQEVSVSSSGDSTVTASVTVKNDSERDGTEVVQLYVVDTVTSVVVPNKSLRGFEKVQIAAGESVTVDITVPVKDLGLWDARMKYVVEPGEFVVLVGSSSSDIRGNATFTVV